MLWFFIVSDIHDIGNPCAGQDCVGDCQIFIFIMCIFLNMFFLYSQEKKETKICFIDFQVMRYSSPLTDILYFLFLCTDSTFRTAYFDNLLINYYDSLKSFLNLYGIDANSVYAKEDFDNDCKELLPFGLLVAMVELRIVTTSPEDEVLPKVTNIVVETGDKELPGEQTFFKMRVNDVVKECIENGVLDRVVEKLNRL